MAGMPVAVGWVEFRGHPAYYLWSVLAPAQAWLGTKYVTGRGHCLLLFCEDLLAARSAHG